MTEDSENSWSSPIQNSKWWVIRDAHRIGPENEEVEQTEMATLSVESGFETLYEQIQTQLEDFDGESTFDDELGESLLLYFLTANALLERHSIEFLAQSRVSDEMENYDSLKSFFDNELTQSKRESLLHAAGLIDDGLKGEMSQTRKIRNKVAHNPQKGLMLSEDHQQFEADVDRAYRAVNRIEHLCKDCAFPSYNADSPE